MPPHVEFEAVCDFKRAICDDFYLVQGSVIKSLFERGASLTNHKAAKIVTKFTMASRDRTLMKRILSNMLEGRGEICADSEAESGR